MKTAKTLIQEGPTPKALTHSSNLYTIQQKYVAWLTPDILPVIDKFEAALRGIGVRAQNEPYFHKTGNLDMVNQMYDNLYNVLGITKEEGKQVESEIAATTIINFFQKLLGIEELTQIRRQLLKNVRSL
ncbi:MAG: hypothetical protein HY790_06590 [Deltaproteobacteria bacterium]|nr:hypothetical protein [Deltaproteobacteria bacterium]